MYNINITVSFINLFIYFKRKEREAFNYKTSMLQKNCTQTNAHLLRLLYSLDLFNNRLKGLQIRLENNSVYSFSQVAEDLFEQFLCLLVEAPGKVRYKPLPPVKSF